MTFGERVLALRTEKGMTQDELAHAVGYKSRSTIAKIESGERDPHQSMIAAIAKALDTTPAYLMGWEDKKPTVEELYGKMIKRLREQQNLSVDELSKICHIDSNYLIVERIAMNYTFGQQRAVFVEECAEAIQAVCKLDRAQSPEKYSRAMAALISEVADVLIMAQQMRFFLGKEKVDDEIRRKVERQLRRIRGEENE